MLGLSFGQELGAFGWACCLRCNFGSKWGCDWGLELEVVERGKWEGMELEWLPVVELKRLVVVELGHRLSLYICDIYFTCSSYIRLDGRYLPARSAASLCEACRRLWGTVSSTSC